MKLPEWIAKPFDFTKELFINFSNDDSFTLGASLAYYIVFSFAPMLVILLSITSFFAGKAAVASHLFEQLEGLLGKDAAQTVQELVANAYLTGDSWWAMLIGIGTLPFTATTVFNALKTSINRIWELEARPGNTIMGFVLDRVLSFSMVLVLGFMLLITLVLNAAVVAFVERVAAVVPLLGATMLAVVSFAIDLTLTTCIIASLFRFLPDAKVRWRDIWAGAIFTSLLFVIGKVLIGFYIGNSDFSSSYGAAAGLITLLVWTYYNSQIIFLGAEFTWVWARRSGHPIQPNDYAVHVVHKVQEMPEGTEPLPVVAEPS